MTWLARLGRLARTLFRGRQLDHDLDEELESYIAEMTARYVRSGMAPADARRAALREVGGVEPVKERVREVRVGWGIETTLRDLRYGVRTLRRSPGFALVVVLTLAIGIGATVTMFSVMYSVLWRALPYPDAARLVLLSADVRTVTGAGLAPGERRDLEASSKTLGRIAALSGVDAHLNIDGELERVFAVSSNDHLLVALGAAPALGRLPREADDIGNPFVRAVVISDSLWRRRFSADPAVIGRHIQVNNLDVEVVGVLRPGLRVFLPLEANAAEEVDVWFPRGAESQSRSSRDPVTIARLEPGVSIAQAQAELDAISARAVADHRDAYGGGPFRMTVAPLQEVLTARVRPALLALGAAVAFVLLIACVNVTNLMLARAKTRERELAVRRAVGAERRRIVRQLFTESLVLAAMGGAGGLAAGAAGVRLLEWLRPEHLPRQSQVAIDGTVALYSVLVSVAVCLVFGIVPALRMTPADETQALRAGRSGNSASGVRRLQRGLVIAEVALSIIPLVAGGLMLRTFWNLTHAPIGFNPDGLVTGQIEISFRAFPEMERRWELQRTAIERVRQLPGVEAVSGASPLPLEKIQYTWRTRREDADPNGGVLAAHQMVFPGYFDLMRTRLHEGRDFTDDDVRHKRPVALIDERLARQLWPDGGALGRRIAFNIGRRAETLEVIGITDAVRVTQVRDEAVPNVFVPYHIYTLDVALVIRTKQSAAELAPALRAAVEGLGTGRPVTDIRAMSDYVADSLTETRFTMLLLIGFAGASLLLAAIGLYGTLSYLISQRTQEFGVRMALGATTQAIVRLVASEGLAMAAIGTIAGLAGALALSRGLTSLLYGVTPLDMPTLAGVLAVIGGVSLIAASVPAWRASRVDPSVAIRNEG